MIYNFKELQELELRFGLAVFPYRVLLSSITSTQLRKIVLRVLYPLNRYISQREIQGLAVVDTNLCDMVDRLRVAGYRHTLEVELRFTKVGIDPVRDRCVKLLPEFEEKGVVIITAEGDDGDRVYYSSALPQCPATFTASAVTSRPPPTPPILPQIRPAITQGSSRPRPRTSANLLPEILDRILGHIASTNRPGRRDLIACALVATWWVGPSQRHLFSSVALTADNYQRWMNGVVLSGAKVRLLNHVRSLWHTRSLNPQLKHRMQDLPRDAGKYLSAMHNLRSLTFYNARIEHINEEGFRTCFSAFHGTLTHLSLQHFHTSFSAFVALVDYFPNLRSLQLHTFTLRPDEGPVPTLSRPLRGRIHIRQVDCLEFYNRFVKLDQEYEELEIAPSSFSLGTSFLESALRISPSTVKYLKLIAPPRCE